LGIEINGSAILKTLEVSDHVLDMGGIKGGGHREVAVAALADIAKVFTAFDRVHDGFDP